MAVPLEPNRIHSLPVQVSYHLQASSQTFSALFPTPQQVYVHPNAGSSQVDGRDEAWGAIHLKTVVQGILMASPELHPSHPGTPDLSLYVLDPRQTFLRRSRSSAPLSHPRGAANGGASNEVWTGKGLVTWALQEPGEGKNLITGRLVRRPEFVGVESPAAGMSALEALAASNSSDAHAAWGIEVSVGLKSGLSGSLTYPGPLHHTVEKGLFVDSYAAREQPTSTPSVVPAHSSPTVAGPSSTPKGSTFATASSASKAAPAKPAPRGRPRKNRQPAVTAQPLKSSDLNRLPSSSASIRESDDSLDTQDESYTKEIHRLLAKPEFLNVLEKITGVQLNNAMGKRPAAVPQRHEEVPSKRPRVARSKVGAASSDRLSEAEEYKCSNCGTTKSSVWRTKTEDGHAVRVCNACGLYFNKTRMMRPSTMWTGVDDNSAGRANRLDKAAGGGGFKRTLTMVAEKDARRIATQRATRTKTAAMTSPPRPSVSMGKSVRNTRFSGPTTVAASSPGGWAKDPSSAPADQPLAPTSSGAAPPSGRNTVRNESMPSLAMPLSDDNTSSAAIANDGWNADLSAFFNVDGFAMTSGGGAPRESPAPRQSVSEIQGVSSILRNANERADDGFDRVAASSEDDVFSQLFQRTSSANFDDSPAPFDFSQLPPSSPPSLPSNLPHSALLLSSPSGSPLDVSPHADSEHGGPPQQSGLRHSITLNGDETFDNGNGNASDLQDLLSKLPGVGDDLLALLNAFPAAAAV